jgi:predicted methyltransferase
MRDGSPPAVRVFIDLGASVQPGQGQMSLHICMEKGLEAVVAIQKGAGISAVDRQEKSPLYLVLD